MLDHDHESSLTPHERTLRRLGMQSAPAVQELDTPQLQGGTDSRPADRDDNLLKSLIHLPAGIASLEHMVVRVLHTIQEALAPQAWANSADISNVAANNNFGAQSAVCAFFGYTLASGARLRNITVGASAAAVINLAIVYIEKTTDLVSPAANTPRIVGTLRTTTNNLTAWFPGEILLKQGESLIVVVPAGGSISLDFSCDYRLLPQG